MSEHHGQIEGQRTPQGVHLSILVPESLYRLVAVLDASAPDDLLRLQSIANMIGRDAINVMQQIYQHEVYMIQAKAAKVDDGPYAPPKAKS